MSSIITYVDSLAKKNSEALSFIPRPRLELYEEAGQILLELENNEPCGFIVHGNDYRLMRIFQACIQYDARRREHGLALVKRLIEKAQHKRLEGIRLKCAQDLEANEFWEQCGFEIVQTIPGGKRRGRILNVWHLPLQTFPQSRLFA